MSHQQLDLAAVLHRHGYRMTPQRQIVLDALCQAGGHVTPEHVYERVQTRSAAVNRATVYRVLRFLQELKIVSAAGLPDGRLAYEITGTRPHHHLVCADCGSDVEISDELFAGLAAALGEQHGFQLDVSHLTLRGLCRHCRQPEPDG